jgi:hypothetical protein
MGKVRKKPPARLVDLPAEIGDFANWTALAQLEVVQALSERKLGRKRRPSKASGDVLVIRSHLRPLDIYAYLKARFGPPNGFLTMIKDQEDSDNWAHWDYVIQAGQYQVAFVGTTRDVHVSVQARLSDAGWKALIVGLKGEFARLGREKSEVVRSLEKWTIFQNKYGNIADLCADLHQRLSDADKVSDFDEYVYPKYKSKRTLGRLQSARKVAATIYQDCLVLSMATPVYAEAAINMMIQIAAKPALRTDEDALESFIRLPMPDKLERLSEAVDGLLEDPRAFGETYDGFMRVWSKRNDRLHGNLHPKTDYVEVVYFDDKTPLFAEGGDNVGRFIESLHRVHQPDQVIADYEAATLFVISLMAAFTPPTRFAFDQIMNDPYPGYDAKRRIFGKLFPNHAVQAYFEGMRTDDELRVSWD